MTLGGWIFMVISVSFVIGLASFCFYRVLTLPGKQTQTDTPTVARQ